MDMKDLKKKTKAELEKMLEAVLILKGELKDKKISII